MSGDGAHIRIKLDTEQPVALDDFVGSFVGIGSQFEKFVARQHPDIKADSEFFVKEVRAGCIEADLVAWVAPVVGALPGMSAVDMIDKAQILTTFVKDVERKISAYFRPKGRDPQASKSDLSDYLKTVKAIASDPAASGNIEAATFEADGRRVRAAFRFKSSEAKAAERRIADHRKELEAKVEADQNRVLLRFVRPSVEASKPGKKGGERAVIESIHKRALPVLYASDLAEQRMHHEKLQLEGNIFRALFDVDVNVEVGSAGRPIAYRLKNVYAVIDNEGEESLDL